MPESCEDSDNEGDKIDESEAIPTTSSPRWTATELNRFNFRTTTQDVYEGDDADDADADKDELASLADDGLTQTLED